jgi:uncharacterized DUF497 family protein
MIKFEWDAKKATDNVRKHGISFEDAIEVFDDPLAIRLKDRIVRGEQRWHLIGMAGDYFLLLIVHTIHESDDTEVVRIISARGLTPKERRLYEHG